MITAEKMPRNSRFCLFLCMGISFVYFIASQSFLVGDRIDRSVVWQHAANTGIDWTETVFASSTSWWTTTVIYSQSKSETAMTINANNGSGAMFGSREKLNHVVDDAFQCMMEDSCLRRMANAISRAWTPKQWRDWCQSAPTSDPHQPPSLGKASNETGSSTDFLTGLLLVKIPKSASSTVAGIVLRIHHRKSCPVEWQHRPAMEYAPARRGTSLTSRITVDLTGNRNFLMAPIRQPAARALSSIYFHKISFHGNKKSIRNDQEMHEMQPNHAFLVAELQRMESNYILHYASLETFSEQTQIETDRITQQSSSPDHFQEEALVREYKQYLDHMQGLVQGVINDYNFLVVVERMDESLVALSWLTGLHVTDLLTASAKQSGSFYFTGRQCIPLAKPPKLEPVKQRVAQQSQQPTLLQNYLSSSSWRVTHAGDLLLHAAAQTSLDLTIAAMGQDLFEQRLAELRDWQGVIKQRCDDETYFPCSRNGTLQLDQSWNSCYQRDFGCGYPCIDRLVDGSRSIEASEHTKSSCAERLNSGPPYGFLCSGSETS